MLYLLGDKVNCEMFVTLNVGDDIWSFSVGVHEMNVFAAEVVDAESKFYNSYLK